MLKNKIKISEKMFCIFFRSETFQTTLAYLKIEPPINSGQKLGSHKHPCIANFINIDSFVFVVSFIVDLISSIYEGMCC